MTSARTIRGRYVLREELRRTSMSVTHAAEDSTTGALVVLKEVVLGDRDGMKRMELFDREAKILENLNHPGIPKFIDSFEEEARFWIAQERRPGKDLAEMVAGGWHGSAADIERILRAIADVLEYLHSRVPPIVHRDVKPANILVGPDGLVSLIDLGAVSTRVFDPQSAGGSTIVGTPGYVPLEQFSGHAVPASDIYALGMVGVFLATHREPAELMAPDGRVSYRHLTAIDHPTLAGTIDRMTEPLVQNRLKTAREVKDQLDGKTAVAVRPVDEPSRWKRILRGPALAAAMAIGVISLGSFAWWLRLGADVPVPPEPAVQEMIQGHPQVLPQVPPMPVVANPPLDAPECSVRVIRENETEELACEAFRTDSDPIVAGVGKIRAFVDFLPEGLENTAAREEAEENIDDAGSDPYYVVDFTPDGEQLFGQFQCEEANIARAMAEGGDGKMHVACVGSEGEDGGPVIEHLVLEAGAKRAQAIGRPIRLEAGAEDVNGFNPTLVVPARGPSFFVYRRYDASDEGTSLRVQALARGARPFTLGTESFGRDTTPELMFLRGDRLHAIYPAVVEINGTERQQYRALQVLASGSRAVDPLVTSEELGTLACNQATTSRVDAGLEIRLPNDFSSGRLVAKVPDGKAVPGPTSLPREVEVCAEPGTIVLRKGKKEVSIRPELGGEIRTPRATCRGGACVVAWINELQYGDANLVIVRLAL